MGSFSSDWFFLFFLINLIILAYVRTNYPGYILRILTSSISYGTSYNLFRDSKNIKAGSGFLLLILSLFSSAIFLFKFFEHYNPLIVQKYGLVIFASLIVFLIITAFFNKIINWFFGILFLQEELSAEYNRNIDFFNQIAGILLFPVSVLCIYSNIPVVSIYTGLTLTGLVYLLRIVRLLKINFNKEINFFYMFLYLCTVEIIPLVYLIKVLSKP